MTLQEALRSGSGIRREGQRTWRYPVKQTLFTQEEIVAVDWEVESQAVLLTNHDFIKAVRPLIKSYPHLETIFWELGQNLGFARK